MIKELEITSGILNEYVESFQKMFSDETPGKEFDLNLHSFFIITTIQNIDGIHSINELIKHSHLETSYYSIGQILRTLCLNGIIALYILSQVEEEKVDEDQKEVRKLIEILFTDQIQKTYKHLKKHFEHKSKEEKLEMCETINSNYKVFLNTDVKPNDRELDFKVKGEFPNNAECVKKSNYPIASESLYDKYTYYSKFEHIGADTYRFFTRIFVANTREVEINSIREVLRDTIHINKSIMVYFRISSQDVYDDLFELSKEIEDYLESEVSEYKNKSSH